MGIINFLKERCQSQKEVNSKSRSKRDPRVPAVPNRPTSSLICSMKTGTKSRSSSTTSQMKSKRNYSHIASPSTLILETAFSEMVQTLKTFQSSSTESQTMSRMSSPRQSPKSSKSRKSETLIGDRCTSLSKLFDFSKLNFVK